MRYANIKGIGANQYGIGMVVGRVAEVVLRDVMTTNATQHVIDIADRPLAGRLRRGAPGDAKAAGEYAEIKQRLARLSPVMLYSLLGTLAGAVAYVRLDLWCLMLAIPIIGALLVCAARPKKPARTLAYGIYPD